MSNSVPPLPPEVVYLTNTDTVAQFLRKFGRFILYKAVWRNGKLLKLPFSPYDPYGHSVDPLDPSHWASFEEAVAVLSQLDKAQFGIGFVLFPGITCLDIDGKDDPNGAREFVESLRSQPDGSGYTWAERSVSGQGFHFWYIGMLPGGLTSIMPSGKNDGWNKHVEVYGDKRFIALTGNMIEHSASDLTDGGGLIHKIGMEYLERRGTVLAHNGTPLDGVTYDLGRGHMSDERALLLLSERKPESYAHLCQPAPEGQGSDRLQRVTGDLDKILADPDQVFRIIESSPLGQSRQHGFVRKFWKYWLPDARRSNDQGIWNRTREEQAHLIEHGKLYLSEIRTPDQVAAASTEAALEADDELYDSILGQYDRHSMIGAGQYILDQLDPNGAVKDPEAIKHLTLICHKSMQTQNMEFARHATLAAFSSLFSMAYRTECDLTSANNWLIVAEPGAGKDEALSFWPRGMQNTSFGKFLTNAPIMSAQALWEVGKNQRTVVQYVPDAGNDIGRLNPNAKEASVVLFRDTFNKLHDLTKFHDEPFMRPQALTAMQQGVSPRYFGFRFSTIYGVPPDVFDDMFDVKAIKSGVGSRFMILHRPNVKGKYQVGARPVKTIPQPIIDNLIEPIGQRTDDLLALWVAFGIAKDEEFNGSRPNANVHLKTKSAHELWQELVNKTIVVRYSPCALEIERRLQIIHNKLVEDFENGSAGKADSVFSRLIVTAKKFAMISAILRSPWMPVISGDDLLWGAVYGTRYFSTVVQNIEEGGGGNADDATRRQVMMDHLPDDDAGLPEERRGVAKSRLLFLCGRSKAFKDERRGTDELFTKTLKMLVETGAAIDFAKGRGQRVRRTASRRARKKS